MKAMKMQWAKYFVKFESVAAKYLCDVVHNVSWVSEFRHWSRDKVQKWNRALVRSKEKQMNDNNVTALNFSSSLHRLTSSVLVSLFVLCAGCSSNPFASNDYPPVPESQRDVDVDYDYILGPGDALSIHVWGNEELSTSGVVRPDGKLTTQLVEDIQASGKTSTQLARDIEVAYSDYVRQPVVSVISSTFVGVPWQTIRVLGEATNPKRVPYKKHMTLLDLMISVGGLTDYADGNNSVLIRMVDGQQVTYSLRLDDLVRDGDITADLSMMPGDILIITESWF
jgi:polysaccharide biosynthesis/export protein